MVRGIFAYCGQFSKAFLTEIGVGIYPFDDDYCRKVIGSLIDREDEGYAKSVALRQSLALQHWLAVVPDLVKSLRLMGQEW